MTESKIQVEHKPSPMKLEVLGVQRWKLWKKPVSTFDWSYQQQETCYIVRGRFTVTPEGEAPQQFERGDLITFPAGMNCTWDITQDVEKYFDFQ